MTPLERDALPGALLDPLIARLRERLDMAARQRYDSLSFPVEFVASVADGLEKAREALLP